MFSFCKIQNLFIMINYHQSSFFKKSGTVGFNQSRQCGRASLHGGVQLLCRREHELIVSGAGSSSARRCLRLQGATGAGRRETTHGHGLREATMLGGGVGVSAHAMWWCWAFSSRRFRLNVADTEVMWCSILIEADDLMHDYFLIIKQCVIISNLQLRDVMVVAVVEGLGVKKASFSSFNISQILPYCSQLTLSSIHVEFQALLPAVIKQDVKLSIDSIAVPWASAQDGIPDGWPSLHFHGCRELEWDGAILVGMVWRSVGRGHHVVVRHSEIIDSACFKNLQVDPILCHSNISWQHSDAFFSRGTQSTVR